MTGALLPLRRAFLVSGTSAVVAFTVFLLVHVSDSIGEPLTATPATGDPEIAALSE